MNWLVKQLTCVREKIAALPLTLRLGLVAVLGVVLFCLANYSTHEGVRDFVWSMIPELIGMSITVFVIDQLIRFRDDREKRRIEVIAMKKIRRVIGGDLCGWLPPYKASLDSNPQPPATTPQMLLDADLVGVLIYLDLNKPSTTWSIEGKPFTWGGVLARQAEGTLESLNKLLDRYCAVIPSNVLFGLEQLIESHIWGVLIRFSKMQHEARASIGAQNDFTMLSEGGIPGMLMNHFELMKRLLQLCDAIDDPLVLDNFVAFWNPGGNPAIGSGRGNILRRN